MEIDYEIVLTSDPEEHEELAANEAGYWTTMAEEIRLRRTALPLRSIISDHFVANSEDADTIRSNWHALKSTTSGHRQDGVGLRPTGETSSPVQARRRNGLSHSPPRKRRKLAETSTSSPGTPLSSRTNLPSSPSSPAKSLQDDEIPIPVKPPRSISSAAVPTSPRQQSDVRYFRQGPVSLAQRSVSTQETSTGTPPSSPDPLLLFTPQGRSVSPALQPAAQFSSICSPLTPASSLTKPRASHQSSPGPSKTGIFSDLFDDDEPLTTRRNLTPPAPPQTQDEQALHAAIELAQVEDRSRYSLRARKPRQLNPYEFDKRMYKKQMRANPDAIVSPHRHRRQRSTSASGHDDSSEVDDDYVGGEADEAEEEKRRRRRRGKEEAADAEEEESRSPKRGPSWLPDVFNESFSSDDEELLTGPSKKPEKERLRKRPRPFPMKVKDLHGCISLPKKSPSPAQKIIPPRSRPRPRAHVHVAFEPPIESEETSFAWHQHHSVPVSSQTRMPNSSPPQVFQPHMSGSPPPPPQQGTQDTFLAPGDGDYNVFDEFARGQSPLQINLSQLADHDSSMLDPSSEAHDPPTTPSAVIDIASDSDSDDSRASFRTSSSSQSMDEDDRKRLKVLSRMMPQVMIKRLEAQARAKARRARTSVSAERDDDDAAERPLRPGESRKRVGDRTLSSRSVEIRGDSESSDVEISTSRDPSPAPELEFPILVSSESDEDLSVIEPIQHHRPLNYRPPTRADNAREDSASDVSNIEDVVDRWIGVRVQRSRPDTQVKERDLIDRMLSRTDVSSASRKRRRTGGLGTGGGRREDAGGHRVGNAERRHPNGIGGSRPVASGVGQKSGGGGAESSRLRVVTTGAKRHGAGRQTLLNFARLLPPDVAEDEVPPAQPLPSLPNEVVFTEDQPAKAKRKMAKLKAMNAGVYVFPGAGGHLMSGRANLDHITVDQGIIAPRGPAPLRREAACPPNSKPTNHDLSNEPRPATLEDYWELANDEYEHDDFVVPDNAAPESPSQHKREWDNVRRVTDDLDVHPLPAGIAFPNATYVGHGWLHELINLLPGTHDVTIPPSCSMFDCHLHSHMSATDFTSCLDSVSDQLRNLILGSTGPTNHETCRQWQIFFHAVSQHLSMLLYKAQADDRMSLVSDVESLVRRLGSLMEEPVEILPDDEIPNPLVLQILWFLLEVACRIASDCRRRLEEPDRDMVGTCLQALLTRLWDQTFGVSAIPFVLTHDTLIKSPETRQLAESWVCLVNLGSDETFQASLLPQNTTFWTAYLQLLATKGLLAPHTDLKAREAVWKSIFSLCAISQFSMHGNSSMTPRINPSWQVIASILERSPLSADPVADLGRPKSSLRKRDHYVRTLVSRCLLLHLKWRWRLDVDDPVSMFNRLLEIFKGRKFASLLDEGSDLPGFLRHNNLALLQERRTSDTAFTLFLKLVVQAAEDMRKENAQLAPSAVIPQKLKKILSLAVPVGAVGFTKDKPPSSRDLSMLYNRFSAIAVAIYLEPVPSSVEYRVAKLARRYVVFRDADNETRRACIRGAMHLGILLRHLRLPLTDILAWLTEMTDILIDEYQAPDAVVDGPGVTQTQRKEWIVLTVHLLLGCVRHILETSSMDPEQSEHKYPDPALLQGPWVTRVFSTTTNLSTITSTGDEIRRLVQAFLDARSRVIHKPRRPPPRVAVEESEESQEYGHFDLDLEDPELLAALGEDVGLSDHRKNKEKDGVICEIIDRHISPAIYRLVCKHFNDPVYQQKGELSFQDADRWIDCWVGCASVMVQNGKRDWSFYFHYGSQSWEKIIECDWRRRVGLRFMYMLLQLDPPAYLSHTEQFVDVLLQSIATPNVTLEHEYASLLFSIDRLYHPLFRDLPIDPPGEDHDYHIKKQVFSEKRLVMLEVMIKNLADNLAAERGDTSLTKHNQIHITSVITMLSTMKEICNQLEAGTVTRALYVTFCKQILDILLRYPAVSNHTRFITDMHWLRNLQ